MMAALSPREQQVHDVVYREDKPYDLAAGRLGISVGGLKFHIHNIRKKLRAAGQPLPDKRRHFVTH